MLAVLQPACRTTMTSEFFQPHASLLAQLATRFVDSHSYRFHYVMDNGIIYLCLTERTVRQNLAFTYLEDIKQRFQSMYRDRVQTAIAFAMNGEFSRIIAERMVGAIALLLVFIWHHMGFPVVNIQ